MIREDRRTLGLILYALSIIALIIILGKAEAHPYFGFFFAVLLSIGAILISKENK